MKIVLLACLTLSVFSALAMEKEKERPIAEVKAKIITNLDTRITLLQDAKTCTSAATTKEQLKACRKTMQDKLKGMKQNWRDQNKDLKKK